MTNNGRVAHYDLLIVFHKRDDSIAADLVYSLSCHLKMKTFKKKKKIKAALE